MATETQQSIAAWMEATFPGADPGSPRKCVRALEEVLELCLAAGASPVDVRRVVMAALDGRRNEDTVPRPAAVPAEAADVLIVLYGVAHLRGFDLHAEVDRKMAINRGRKWHANGDGTGYHVKES